MLAASVNTASAQATGEQAYWLYGQVGASEHGGQLTAGLQLPWPQSWRFERQDLAGYWDISLSRWRYTSTSTDQHEWLTQFGAKPTLRWWAWRGAFVELGVGVTGTSRLYETDGKRFSSRFNFASHLGLGFPLGEQRTQELVVRVEHLSNGGIRRPNPGENFLQVRYAHRF